MKNTLVKDALRELKKTFGRFMAIFAIVAIGCGFFAGIKATMPDMLQTAEDYFSEKRLMDIHLTSTIGVRSKDVETVKSANGVEGVMAGYSKDVYYLYNSQNMVLKFMSYNSALEQNSLHKLNKPELLKGRYPKNDKECLIEIKATSPNTFKIGNSIKISEPDGSKKITDTLTSDTYKIVGIVASPMYIGYERDSTNVGDGTVVSNVFVPEEDFKGDYYTDMYVRYKGSENYKPFSDSYKEFVKNLREDTVNKFTESVDERFDEMKNSAENKLDSAQKSRDSLKSLLACDEKKLRGMQASLNNGIKKFERQKTAYSESSAEYLLLQGKISSANDSLKIIGELLKDKNGKGQFRQKYLKQLETANKEIADGEKQLENMAEPKIYSFDRFEASVDYSSFYSDAEKINSISKVFPVFFIVVAALVCLTTMTRMVEEQRTLMGTYKALGISSVSISAKYVFYAFTASACGGIIGTVVGLKLIPKIIYDSYKIMYNIPKIAVPIRWSYVLGCTAVACVCISAAALIACRNELNSVPASLMRPKPPQNGKRVFLERFPKLWNKFSFLEKITIRNSVRYKKRFIMTVLGAAGCTALIVTAFGLKNSIKTIADKQFNDVMVYTGLVMLNNDNYSEDSLEKNLEELKEVKSHMLIASKDITVKNDGKSYDADVMVVKNANELDDYIHLRDKDSGKQITVNDGEAVATEKLCKLLNVKAGDTVYIDHKGKKVGIKIKAISKNYAMHYIYMTPKTYRESFGENEKYNLALVNLYDKESTEFKEQIIKKDEFYGIAYKGDSSKGFLNSVDSLDSVVLLLIICAGGLAMVVLYNLANINITERIREIASLKVLGFYENETAAYICRENYISAIAGVLLGLGLGKILHYFVVITSEVDIVMFNRELVWWAYLLGGLLTLVFTVTVNLILRFTIGKIPMVESLKSVE